MKRAAVVIVVVGWALGAALWAQTLRTIFLSSGDVARVTCDGQRLDSAPLDPRTVDLSCVPSSRIPLPTGDSPLMRYWHAPGPHDGLNPHEHGDRPPEWVSTWSAAALGTSQLYGYAPVATPGENHMKHQAYKGLSATLSGVDVYVLFHAQTNGLDWMAPRHSFRLWVRDQTGGVSYQQGQIWFGWPDVRTHRLSSEEEQPGYYGPDWRGRGPHIVRCRISANPFPTSEQWYGMLGPSLQLGLTISPAAAFCNPEDMPTMEEAMDMSTWALSGEQPTYRRFEVSWYGPATPYIEQPWIDGWSCRRLVPFEPQHTHDSQPWWDEYGPVLGPTACLPAYVPQYVAPTMPRRGISASSGNTVEQSVVAAGMAQPQ